MLGYIQKRYRKNYPHDKFKKHSNIYKNTINKI